MLCSSIKVRRILAITVKINFLRTLESNKGLQPSKYCLFENSGWIYVGTGRFEASDLALFSCFFPQLCKSFEKQQHHNQSTYENWQPSSHWRGQNGLGSPKASLLKNCHYLSCLETAWMAPIHRAYLHLTWLWAHHWEQFPPQGVCQKQSAAII